MGKELIKICLFQIFRVYLPESITDGLQGGSIMFSDPQVLSSSENIKKKNFLHSIIYFKDKTVFIFP